MSVVIESANPVVKAVIEGKAPRPARIAAARGILPLPQLDLLEVLVAFATSDDKELSGHAKQTIRTQDTETLNALVRSSEIPVPILTYLATIGELPQKIHESIISNSKTPVTTIIKFAGETNSVGECFVGPNLICSRTNDLADYAHAVQVNRDEDHIPRVQSDIV